MLVHPVLALSSHCSTANRKAAPSTHFGTAGREGYGSCRVSAEVEDGSSSGSSSGSNSSSSNNKGSGGVGGHAVRGSNSRRSRKARARGVTVERGLSLRELRNATPGPGSYVGRTFQGRQFDSRSRTTPTPIFGTAAACLLLLCVACRFGSTPERCA